MTFELNKTKKKNMFNKKRRKIEKRGKYGMSGVIKKKINNKCGYKKSIMDNVLVMDDEEFKQYMQKMKMNR